MPGDERKLPEYREGMGPTLVPPTEEGPSANEWSTPLAPEPEGESPYVKISPEAFAQVSKFLNAFANAPKDKGPPADVRRAATSLSAMLSASAKESTANEVYTAVLLVQRHDGLCIPHHILPDLPKHKEATPHDVLRMCLDVADQISGLRCVGETVNNMSALLAGKKPKVGVSIEEAKNLG